ncbi:MAG: MmgE/PrpD family protein, partial [Casimicrobiaceae bacterium]
LVDRIMETAARTLARFASALKLADVPAIDVDRATQCLIDAVGVALLGSTFAWSQSARHYAEHYGAHGTSRIIGSPGRVSAPMAALANGVAVHAFELDSLRKPGAGVHPGAVLVPAALAIGEELHSSGSEVLAAIVAGCEVMFRIGMASRHSSESLGFHAPGLTGPFGAAIVAGRLLRLDSDRMCHALGIAGSMCSGLLAFAKAGNGAMVKRLHLGRAAESGILAARLAESGFEGPDTILDGKFGFLATYCAESDAALLTAGLGERWETRSLCIKRYPCHVTAHTPVESVRALRDEHGFGADDIAAIRVRASAKVVSHHAAREAHDVMAVQYSVPFCVAIAVVDDVDDPLAFGERALSNPQVAALARKIECEAWPEAPSGWASDAHITLRDGRSLQRANDDFLGTPTSPLSREQLDAKFLRCAAAYPRAQLLLEQLHGIATATDVSALPLG